MTKKIKSLEKLAINKETLIQLDKPEAQMLKGGEEDAVPSYKTCLSVRLKTSR